MDYESGISSETKRQANFLLPGALIEELRRLVPPKKRSQVVAVALDRELSRLKVEEALGSYFGSWKSGRKASPGSADADRTEKRA